MPEPKAAEAIMRDMLLESGVTYIRESPAQGEERGP
jgi:hypothetical protein